MSKTGTYSYEDLKQVTAQTVAQFGLDSVREAIDAEVDAHNRAMNSLVLDFATPTTEREEPEGSVALDGEMEEADEFNRPRTQKISAPGKVGFPLRRFTHGIGWTAEFLANASVAEFAVRLENATAAHRRAVVLDIRRAIFRPTNYAFSPYIADLQDIDVTVKAAFNADGTVPPMSPSLTTFTGSHTHYTTSATLTITAADDLINNVAEHSLNARVRVHINRADEANWKALDGFVPAIDPRVTLGANAAAALVPLDTGNAERLIGYYNGAEIVTRWWAPAGYAAAVNLNAGTKALRMREPQQANRRGLRPVAEIATFPYQARIFEALFGFGVKNRGAFAVLQHNTAGAYALPAGL